MKAKHVKILLIPEGLGAVKQISIPIPWLLLGLVLTCCAVALCYRVGQDYLFLSDQLPGMPQTEKGFLLAKNDYASLSARVEEITRKLEDLLELDQRLRSAVNTEQKAEEAAMLGMGGSEYPVSKNRHSDPKERKPIHRSSNSLCAASLNSTNASIEGKSALSGSPTNIEVFPTSTPSTWPVKGFLRSPFGVRTSPFTGKPEFHKGIDISTRLGAPVAAPLEGVVSSVRWHAGDGNGLSIIHGYGVVTSYKHLEKVFVEEGEWVRKGDRIGLVGGPGSGGPHLHYEVQLNEVAVNPILYLSKESPFSETTISP